MHKKGHIVCEFQPFSVRLLSFARGASLEWNCPAPNKYIETLSTNQKVDSNVITAESGQAALSRIFSLSILTARKESPIVSEIS